MPERIKFTRELLIAARKGKPWRTAFSGAVPPWFDLYLGLETGATEIATFEAYLIPGLLQTDAYAQAVIRGNPDTTDEEIQHRVELRMSGQDLLTRAEEPTRLWAVLDELVLHRERGGTKTMAG